MFYCIMLKNTYFIYIFKNLYFILISDYILNCTYYTDIICRSVFSWSYILPLHIKIADIFELYIGQI